LILYVKYCGGCNPKYDRAKLVQQIEAAMPQIEIIYQTKPIADAALVICGCSTACANKEEAVGTYGVFVIWQDRDLSALYEFLEQVNNRIIKK